LNKAKILNTAQVISDYCDYMGFPEKSLYLHRHLKSRFALSENIDKQVGNFIIKDFAKTNKTLLEESYIHKETFGKNVKTKDIEMQMLLHDVSIFSEIEGKHKAKVAIPKIGRMQADLHHVHNNKYRIEHWVGLNQNGMNTVIPMPRRYVAEFVLHHIVLGSLEEKISLVNDNIPMHQKTVKALSEILNSYHPQYCSVGFCPIQLRYKLYFNEV